MPYSMNLAAAGIMMSFYNHYPSDHFAYEKGPKLRITGNFAKKVIIFFNQVLTDPSNNKYSVAYNTLNALCPAM